MAGVGSLRHLEQSVANELLFRGALWRAAQPYLHDLCDLRLAGQAGLLSTRINQAAEVARQQPSCQEALTSAGAFVAQEMRHELQLDLESSPHEVAVLAGVGDACAAVDATDPYAELFEIVADCAARLYADDWPPVDFSTRRFASPGGIYGVTASTEPAAGPGIPVGVVLLIDSCAFGPESYGAIPALLIHECVCHVPTWQPGRPDNGSVFAEGFMDFAAEYFRALWSVEFGALAPLVDHHGQRVFAEIEARGGLLGVARSRGRHAAQVMKHQLVRRHGETPGHASWLVARLAKELNVAPRPRAFKDRFVERLGADPATPIAEPLLGALKGLTPAADLL